MAELSERYYSEEQVDTIVAAVRLPISAAKRADLHRALNRAALLYVFLKDDLKPAQVRNHLAAIEKAAQKLLNVLGAGNITSQPTFSEVMYAVVGENIVAGGENFVAGDDFELVEEKAIRGIRSLQRWASLALVQAKKNVTPHGRRRDEGRLFFLRALSEIYRKTFDRKPGVTTGSNQPGGPFFRFVNTCLAEIGENLSPERVAKLAKQAKDFNDPENILRLVGIFRGRVT